MIKVGADKEAVVAAREGIMSILECQFVENETKRTALVEFARICEVKNTHIQGNVFHNKDDGEQT